METMRDSVKRLRWVIWLVIGAFIVTIFAVWGGAGRPGQATGGDWAAMVGSEPIKVAEFMGSYRISEKNYRQYIYRRQTFEPASINLGYMVLQEMVKERLMGLGAKEAGLRVTDAELAEAIRNDPSFQEGGRFVGREEYIQRVSQFGISPALWEEQMRWRLLAKKYQIFLTSAAVGVSEQELEKRFLDKYRRVNLRFLLVPEAKLPRDSEVSDTDMRAWYEAHRDKFLVPEERRVEYVWIDVDSLAKTVKATEEDLKNFYERAREFYFVSKDTWRASHILFSVAEDASAADAEKQEILARGVAERAKKGEDFAALARKYSQDTGSAQKGGDLGAFSAGVMVSEFENALRLLKPGQVSDPVRSQFGWHVIKLHNYDPGGYYREFKDVRGELEKDYRRQEAGRLAYETAKDMSLTTAANFAETAAKKGLAVKTTPFFARNDEVPGLGERLRMQAFFMGLHDVSQPIAVGSNYAVLHVIERRENRQRELSDVRETVRHAIQDERRKELYEKWAQPHVAELRARKKTLDQVRISLGANPLEISGSFTRTNKPVRFDQPTPGLFEMVENMPEGDFGAYYIPGTGEKRGLMIFEVDLKSEFDEGALERNKPLMRRELSTARAEEALQGAVKLLQERYPVKVKDEVVIAAQGGKGTAPPPL